MSSTDPATVASTATEKVDQAPVSSSEPSSAPANIPGAADTPSAPQPPASPAETIQPTPGPSHPPTAAERAFQHGLNPTNLEQEVTQVMGTLNSWWGGVKKQSASALSSLRAEVDQTITQAQADLEHLRTAKVEIIRKEDAAKDGASPPEKEVDVKGKGKATGESETTPTATSPSVPPVAANLFNRLSSSTSQLQQSLQTTFQSTLASAKNNPAIANPTQLREQLAKNLQLSSAKENLQLSMKQAEKMAEDYLKKGDQWVKDAEKWMGDAVKVLPPDDGDTRYISTSWDGGDFYAFTTSSTPSPNVTKGNVLFEAESRTPRPSSSTAALAGSRKEALLRRLREDQDLLLVDPEGEAETEERREQFRAWIRDSWEKASAAEKAEELGNVGPIRMALVPERISDEQFWQRYLFHKHMIEASEEKRKKLLEATQQVQADDFSWDDEPEDASANQQSRAAAEATTKPDAAAPVAKPSPKVETAAKAENAALAKITPSTSTSPRDSEESYDLVSDQGGKGAKPAAPVTTASTTEDEDSDWE